MCLLRLRPHCWSRRVRRAPAPGRREVASGCEVACCSDTTGRGATVNQLPFLGAPLCTSESRMPLGAAPPQTFATRVAVSTGAPLSAGVLSGLATLSGPLHGRAALGVLELLASVERLGSTVAVRDWLSQGRPIVGFGHPLYPAGDPRAAALLPQLTLPRAYTELSGIVEDMVGERPNIDFALAVLTKVHRLPPEAPLILFALGRCAGWLAHALEQVTTGHPIRPRARYVGPPVT